VNVHFELDLFYAAQNIVDLPKKVLVFDPRHVSGAARCTPLSAPPFESFVMRLHASTSEHEMCQRDLMANVVAGIGHASVD
jgi:hypothetical protein